MPDASKTAKTPAARRRLKVRSAILKAAERVFATEGEAGVSIRRLAQDIDYSPGAIYKYFESKQDLIDALKEDFFAFLLGKMEPFDGIAEDYPDYAHNFLMTYVLAALEKPHHYAAAFSGIADADAPISPQEEGSLKVEGFMKLRSMIEMGAELGVFRPNMDITQISKSIWASLHGFVSLMAHIPQFQDIMLESNSCSRNDFSSNHINFILNGISK